ncbi:PHP domain-containing protein [Maridesulfovibrio bastinii]|uniref:PHP domain-containing protein n=1 Tax=Maridesulfovibrio bastinii TaxID=47157 RepID=UPI0004044634|nr:PHP domain-containing protein [Maridesulfovibrio bastinii]
MPGVDLHTHSTASDGTLTPSELVKAAKDAGLAAVALTDHDTVSGLPEALEAGKKYGIEVIPGCELSVSYDRGIMHIVGLWIDPYAPCLSEAFSRLVNSREIRNRELVEKLTAVGYPVTYEEVEALATGTLGRPHFARALVHHGYVHSIEEAFQKLLGKDGKAYVPKIKITAEDGIALLNSAGATAVLAHPCLLGVDDAQLDVELERLKGYGLEAIEVYYTSHTLEMTSAYKKAARKFGLLPSGGSDFHGSVKPEIRIGKGTGKLFVHHSVLDDLKALRQSKGLSVNF